MKLIKKLGIAVLIFLIVISVVGMFFPSKVEIERSIIINAPVSIVFEKVNVLKNWEDWSPWKKMDPEMKNVYNDIPSGKGASFSWQGPKSGEGSLLVAESYPDSLIVTDLEFKGEGHADSDFKFSALSENSTKVSWSFQCEVGSNPFIRVFWSIGTSMMKQSFDDGLKSIKDISEKNK
jgi:hypothetical protein